MFKEKCPRCNKPVQAKFRFCPYCSFNLDKEREMRDFGLLGKDDNTLFNEGFGMNLNMNDIFSSMNAIMKDITKDLGKNEKPFSKAISIKLSPGKKPVIETKGFNKDKNNKIPNKKKIKIQEFTEDKLKKFLKLGKIEPETEVRRLSNRVIYEINMPGVKNREDIIINGLETGIEIKALADKKAYIKTIPVRLKLLKARFTEGKLTLEFNA